MRRVAFSMTIDPDGAMHDWVDPPEGFALIKVPTQEAVHILGARGYGEVLLDLCEAERPEVLVTHPPYDYLTEALAERLRACGTRLVGYAFDDEIFAGGYGAHTWAALRRIYDRYVTTREVRWATAPLPPLAPSPAPAWDVVLVGKAYARRAALLEALSAAGLRVCARGPGWPEGFVSRRQMLRLYADAAVVLTTADWEQRAVPMVKHRLLDAAVLGAFQIAQEAPDLRRYFDEDEVPSFADAAELVDKVRAALADPARRQAMAARARARTLREHGWRTRLPELLGPVLEAAQAGAAQAGAAAAAQAWATPGTPGRSRLFDQLLLSLATRAESDGRVAAAAALYEERLRRDADEPAAAAGLGRCLRDLGELEAALPWLARAAATPPPPAAGAIHASVPSFGVGAGLGRLGLWPPHAEAYVFYLAALLDLGRVDEAAAVLDGISEPALRSALGATLRLADVPHLQPIEERLRRFRG